MIVNGSVILVCSTKLGDGVDANGDPVVATLQEKEPVSCNIATVSNKLKEGDSGKYTDASYQVLVAGPIDADCKELKLIDSEGKDLGKLEIIEREYLSFVKRTKLIV